MRIQKKTSFMKAFKKNFSTITSGQKKSAEKKRQTGLFR